MVTHTQEKCETNSAYLMRGFNNHIQIDKYIVCLFKKTFLENKRWCRNSVTHRTYNKLEYRIYINLIINRNTIPFEIVIEDY